MVLFTTGLNPAILAPVSALIVNLDGEENAAERIPILFRFLGFLYGTILILVMLIMPPPKKSKEFQRKSMAANNLSGEVEKDNAELKEFLAGGED
jgi:hypothetical protein